MSEIEPSKSSLAQVKARWTVESKSAGAPAGHVRTGSVHTSSVLATSGVVAVGKQVRVAGYRAIQGSGPVEARAEARRGQTCVLSGGVGLSGVSTYRVHKPQAEPASSQWGEAGPSAAAQRLRGTGSRSRSDWVCV
jgi:hypothetical protein